MDGHSTKVKMTIRMRKTDIGPHLKKTASSWKRSMGGNSKKWNFHDDDSDRGVDCVFEGKQTSFWDMWGDHQDDRDKDEA